MNDQKNSSDQKRHGSGQTNSPSPFLINKIDESDQLVLDKAVKRADAKHVDVEGYLE